MRGEVWWGEVPETKARPYLVLTRDEAIPVLRRILVAPVTRSVRGIPTEVPLGPPEGLPTECVATLDNVVTLSKAMLVRRLGALSPDRRRETCEALRAATDC
jgi:mRNA interferase MazF